MFFTHSLQLAGRYTLIDEIGAGGMSEVWRAQDDVLHRLVAVKTLDQALADDPELRATTQREARAAAGLTHPNITQVYDYGEHAGDDGRVLPFLVMELVDGEDLRAVLTRGPMPWRQARKMAAEVAAALAAAHAIGVVHRDIKPGNIMLTAVGAKVVDFGIAALTGAPPAPAGGPLLGTPTYTAPERLTGAAPQPANDVYSLGAVLYQALTGRAPAEVLTWQEAAFAHAEAATVATIDVPGMPVGFGETCLRCMAADPADRPSAEQVAAALRDPATIPTRLGMPVVATTPPASGPPRHQQPWPAVGAVLAAATAVVVLGVLLTRGAGPTAAGPTAAGPTAAGPTATGPAPTATLEPAPPPATSMTEPAKSKSASPRARIPSAVATTELAATAGPDDVLGRFTAAVNQGAEDGSIDADVASDLRKKARDLQKAMSDTPKGGKPGDRDKKVDEMRARIDQATGAGKIDPDAAGQLYDLLDQM